jgi:hypothetical protein
MTADYYTFVTDHGHSESKLNHSCRFRLLDRCHDLNVDPLSDIFHDFIENPETLDEGLQQFLTSLKRLRTPLDIPDIGCEKVTGPHPDLCSQ